MIFKEILKNYTSTMLFIILIYSFYTIHPHFFSFLYKTFTFQVGEKVIHFSSNTIFGYVILLYAIILPFFYYIEYTVYQSKESKARKILRYFWNRFRNIPQPFTHEEKNAILAWGVKAFFAPLMLIWLFGHVEWLLYHSKMLYSYHEGTFLKIWLENNRIFFFILHCILLVDLLCFTGGYFIEGKMFKNEIISVEPTLLGWIVTLMCYPPFNETTSKIFNWYSQDFVTLENNIGVQIIANIAIVFAMFFYGRASVALGLKASNLTNRGIVSKGPYAIIRHPAYTGKNIAWWIGSLPFFIAAFDQNNIKQILLIIFSLASWTIIYILRAITEEKHLMATSPKEYTAYMQKVPYRFIPGLI